MFFFGALQAVAALAWWLADVTGRYADWHAPYAWTVPPMWAHAWLLLYGVFPFFIFGFLMTAGPNWLGAPKMPPRAYVPAGFAMAAGLVLFYVGLGIARPLAAAGAFLHVAGWLWGAGAVATVIRRYAGANSGYAMVLLVFHGAGIVGSAVFAVSVASASYGYVAYTLHGAVWFFLLPIFLGVSTRMVPFFSSRILGDAVNYRPVWARPVLIVGTLFHGALELAGAAHWLWAVDLPLAVAIARLAWKWGLGKSRGVRLLAVLHISLAMLAAAFLLYAGLSAALAAGRVGRIGLGPLHLLVIGYFAAMAVAMVSRVSLGHSGRPLEADRLTWVCYLGVLLAAFLRVAAEAAVGNAAGSILMVAAAVVLLAAFSAWAWRYVPMYLTPRVDGR
jgi:uncharacterized protein involved in response to NO